jgi:hypothetical protein
MFFNASITSFFNGIKDSYLSLPDADKLVIYIIMILLFILFILIVIMSEQKKVTKKIVDKNKLKKDEDIEVLDFNLDSTEIDEDNEKTRNLKEITDKIQAAIDSRAIDLTNFEQDQEENSIISYEDLMKSVGKKIDSDQEEKFSLPNLVNKIKVEDEFNEETPYVDPVRENKFKSSVFISPVFGVQDDGRKVDEEVDKVEQNETSSYSQNGYEEEEQFLNTLINFRKNLE